MLFVVYWGFDIVWAGLACVRYSLDDTILLVWTIFLALCSLPRKFFFAMAAVGGVLMIYITYFAGGIATNGLAFYWDRFDILHPEGIRAINMLARYSVGIMGAIFVLGSLKILGAKAWAVSKMACLGTETLGVYFVHGHLIRLLSNQFVDLNAGSCILFVSTCIMFGCSFCIVKLTKVTEWVECIVWGFGRRKNNVFTSKR